jgi:hypothetical protein
MDPRMAGTNYATRRNGRTRTAFEEGMTGTTQNTPQRRHAQSLDKGPLQLPRPALADGRANKERSLNYQKEHPHPGRTWPVRCNSTGLWGDQLESTWGFTYWEAGGNDSPPPPESVRAKQTHSGPKFRFVPAATTCAKASRQLVGGNI